MPLSWITSSGREGSESRIVTPPCRVYLAALLRICSRANCSHFSSVSTETLIFSISSDRFRAIKSGARDLTVLRTTWSSGQEVSSRSFSVDFSLWY